MAYDQPATAYVLAPGQARRSTIAWPAIKADASDTAGLLSIFEDTLQPGLAGPPLHLHADTDEAFYVVDGALRVQLGDKQHDVTTGAFVWIPRGTPHAFANSGPTPTRLLGLTVPGGIEDLFADQAQYFAQLQGAPDLATLGRIGARHRSQLLGPPIRIAAPGAAHD